VNVEENRPVIAGLIALVGVAVAVGLVAAVAVVGGAHLVGLGGGHAAAVGGDAGATLDVPKPQKTDPANGPSITLGTSPTTSGADDSQSPTIQKPNKKISLQAGETSVSPMGRIDLTGTYPGRGRTSTPSPQRSRTARSRPTSRPARRG
jgi:hypothetical protein